MCTLASSVAPTTFPAHTVIRQPHSQATPSFPSLPVRKSGRGATSTTTGQAILICSAYRLCIIMFPVREWLTTKCFFPSTFTRFLVTLQSLAFFTMRLVLECVQSECLYVLQQTSAIYPPSPTRVMAAMKLVSLGRH